MDPIIKNNAPADVMLFQEFVKHCNGVQRDTIISAAANLIINCIRQGHDNGVKAERYFDELFGRTKNLMMSHYDSSGKRRGVYAVDQVILPKSVKWKRPKP